MNRDFESYSVMPSAENFRHEYRDGVISVYLDEPEYLLIRLDNSDNTILSILPDSPEFPDDIDPGAPKLIKIEGWYEPEDGTGTLTLDEPGTTLSSLPAQCSTHA